MGVYTDRLPLPPGGDLASPRSRCQSATGQAVVLREKAATCTRTSPMLGREAQSVAGFKVGLGFKVG